MALSHHFNLLLIILLFVFPNASALAGLETSAQASIVNLKELSELQSPDDSKIITLSTGDRDYSLLLQLSDITRNIRKEQMEGLQSIQFFKGTVVGDDKSWVRLSLNGKSISGYIKAFDQLIKISESTNGNYSLRTINPNDPVLVSQGLDKVLIAPKPLFPQSRNVLNNAIAPRDSTGNQAVERVLQISIVVDSRFDDFYNGRGLEQAINVINAVDGLYQEQFGLGVQLKTAILLDPKNDPFLHLNGNIETVLREFRLYTLDNKSLSQDLGLMHLFSGAYDDDDVIGLSWINTVCRTDGFNVSVSTPFAAQMILAAHEMAHSLGAQHDDNQSCEIEFDKVMWPSISRNTEHEFSKCSKSSVSRSLSASCNLDNIDLEIALTLDPSPQQEQSYRVALTVKNKDSLRTADNVTSITQLSGDLEPANIPENCTYFANTLTCTHGSINLADGKQITLDVNVIGAGEQLINTALEFSGFADLAPLNNHASIDLKTANQNDETLETENDELQSSGGSGGGGTGLFLMVILWTSIKIRAQNRL